MSDVTNILSANQTRYALKERLGRGAMATVYRAEDCNLHRDVAIKVLHAHLTEDDTFRSRFEQEARTVASLNHPNIVQVYDFDMIQQGQHAIYYMVMRYIDGQTLVDLLDQCRADQKSLSHQRIAQIIGDIAGALDYAHAHGMVHRDVKPANILIDKDGTAILSDFGIARLAQQHQSNLTQDGSIIGTPTYMSPEQASGQSVDYRSDLYALGIVLFELLTGQPPFRDESTLRVLSMHVNETPPTVSSVMPSASKQLDDIIARALAKNPAERYQSGQALFAALNNVFNAESPSTRQEAVTLPDVPTTITPTTTQQPTIIQTIDTAIVKPIRRNPLGFAAFTIALIALLIVARLAQTPPSSVADTNLRPTQVAVSSMTEADMFFSSTFGVDDPNNMFWSEGTNGMLRTTIAAEDGVLILENQGTDMATYTLVDPDYTYEDAIISLTGTITEEFANDASAYGIVFRYQDSDNYNVFAVDGRGRYSIWTREAGSWRELRNASSTWQADDAINPIGQTNTLMLKVDGDMLTGTINGTEVVQLSDATFAMGNIGIYIAGTSAGSATATIDEFSISELFADSMTDDADSVEAMTDE